MFFRQVGYFLPLAFLFGSTAFSAEPLTLTQCYQYALTQSETVAITQEDIAQARARFNQALGAVLPRLSAQGTELLQDDTGTTGGDNVGSTFTRFSRPEVALTVTQPIFHGMQEFYAIKASRASQSQNRQLVEDAKRLLFQDVASTFYTIARIEREIKTTDQILSVLRGQVKELYNRVDIGKSRESELAAEEAEVALFMADLERLIGEKKVAYDMMSFLTGLDPHPPIAADKGIEFQLRTLEDYLAVANQRPDVRGAKAAIDVARGEVNYEKGGLFPSAAVEANYYPYRVGFQKEIDWDALFTVDVPIFNWTTVGNIREAQSRKKQAELRAQETQRRAVSEVKQAYSTYQSSLSQVQSYERALKQAQKSYDLQRKEFSLGIIDTLDLLQSQRIWLDALRSRDASLTQLQLNYLSLQSASGVTL